MRERAPFRHVFRPAEAPLRILFGELALDISRDLLPLALGLNRLGRDAFDAHAVRTCADEGEPFGGLT